MKSIKFALHINKNLRDSIVLSSTKCNNISTLKSFYSSKLQFKTFFEKSDAFHERDVKKMLEKKYGISDFNKVINKNQETMKQYDQFIKERQDRKLNFNRKNRWQQRELDDIMKNFDIRTAKFKDFAKISRESSILNTKKFNSVEEIYFHIDELLSRSEFVSEEIISNSLDIFIKDFKNFNTEHLENPVYKKFERQVILGITSYTKESTLVKAAKFFDWFNVTNRNCWFNMEKVITSKIYTNFSPIALINILNNFANQGEGSGEFYDLYQYLFWCGKFNDCEVSDIVSLGYNMFLSDQGYDLFYMDLSKLLEQKLSTNTQIFELTRIIQIYSNISDMYNDLFYKLEEIILKKQSIITCAEAAALACGFSIANNGTPELFIMLEGKILEEFNTLDSFGIRDLIRGYIISMTGCDKTFLYVMSEFINSSTINLRQDIPHENNIEAIRKGELKNVVSEKMINFTITEVIFVLKCFHDKLREKDNYKKLGVKYTSVEKLFRVLEELLTLKVVETSADKLLLEEICAVCHYYCVVKIIPREIQKLMEDIILKRIDEIRTKKHIMKFLYGIFSESKMCSTGLMDLLYNNYM